jgi:stress response protein YsnF
MAKTVVGLFENTRDAQQAMNELRSAGINERNLTFVDQASSRFSSMLTGAGIPEQDARIYAQGVQQGSGLIILQALGDRDAERAADILDRNNVVDISGRMQGYQRMSLERSTTSSATANTNLYEGGEVAIPIVEEELRVGKREVEGGGVRVNTRIEETPVNEQVTLRDETVDVHRRRVDRPVSEADLNAIQEGTFEVRETDEQAVVDKTARVVEEVVIDKDVQERTQTINDTVRRTDVDVDQIQGGTRTTGATTTGSSTTSGNEGVIERGASRAENAAERLTGSDLNRDGDVGQRDPRNNY